MLDDGFELARCGRVLLGDRLGLTIQDGVEYERNRCSGERLPARGELIQHGAERKDVGARVELLAPRLLGRHVSKSAQGGTGPRQRGVFGSQCGCGRCLGPVTGCCCLAHLGQPEVEHFGVAAAVHEDVRRFDIAVHYAAVVSGIQGVGDLYGQFERPVHLERTGMHETAQGLPLEQFHHDVKMAALFTEVVDRADVRMVQARSEASLAPEALQRFFVARELGRENLDCYQSVEPRVAGAIHHAHPAGADLLENGVMGEGGTDHSNPQSC